MPVPATPKTSVIAEFIPSLSVAFKIIKSTPELSFSSKLVVKLRTVYESTLSTKGLLNTLC